MISSKLVLSALLLCSLSPAPARAESPDPATNGDWYTWDFRVSDPQGGTYDRKHHTYPGTVQSLKDSGGMDALHPALQRANVRLTTVINHVMDDVLKTVPDSAAVSEARKTFEKDHDGCKVKPPQFTFVTVLTLQGAVFEGNVMMALTLDADASQAASDMLYSDGRDQFLKRTNPIGRYSEYPNTAPEVMCTDFATAETLNRPKIRLRGPYDRHTYFTNEDIKGSCYLADLTDDHVSKWVAEQYQAADQACLADKARTTALTQLEQRKSSAIESLQRHAGNGAPALAPVPAGPTTGDIPGIGSKDDSGDRKVIVVSSPFGSSK